MPKIGLWTALVWIADGIRDVMLSRVWDAVTARRQPPKARTFTYTGILPVRIRLAATLSLFVPGPRPEEMA